MGVAIAGVEAEYGAEVDLVIGPVQILPSDRNIKITSVITAESMASECISRFSVCDIAILSAAVADFTPEKPEKEKIKKDKNDLLLRLKPTQDIAETLGKLKKPSQILVGFALETNNEIINATGKLKRKNLDFIVLNHLNEEGAGFEHDTNRITIIDRYNIVEKFELKTKEEVARDILNKIVSML
jgi:phosphopantothenoylcysteine decarboxylase / phosphopantothenate---cysteine ligase